jgi:hypothetical protein
MGRHQQRRDFWERQIAEWAQSGQSASTWCAERGLSPGRFYLWRRRLRSDGDAPQAADLSFTSPRAANGPLRATVRVGDTDRYGPGSGSS